MTDWSKPIQVASVQTLQRRGMPEVDLAIVDEAHVRNQWLEKQFGSEDWGKKPVIGLSATPWSKGLGLIYEELIETINMRCLIEHGRMLNFRVFVLARPAFSCVSVKIGREVGREMGWED